MHAKSIGGMVRYCRRRAGMTQVDLAQACGIAQSAIARIERGTVAPRSATLLALLQATGHELAVDRTIGATVDQEPLRERLRLSNPGRTRRALGKASGPTGPIRILRRLRRFGVRFVLIGPLAEAAHGAPGAIEPAVEICHARDSINLERLAMALRDLGAEEPTFLTEAGRLTLDPEPAGDDFDVLARNARRTMIDTGLLVLVAALDDLIRIRRWRAQPGDREALELLGALRDLRA